MIAARSRPARWIRLPRMSIRALGAVALAAVILGCGWLWLRSSPLVRIQNVTVTGLSGPDVPQIRRTLITTAEQMTTLDVSMSRLDASVGAYPDVTSLRISTHVPHSAVIHVVEQVPVATVEVDGRAIVVDSAGRLLARPPQPIGPLPTIPLRQVPDGTRLPTAGSRAAVRALAAAPYALISHIANATSTASRGVVVQLRNGPQLDFGSTAQLPAKWLAAVAVLDDPSSSGAAYIDVTDPFHPAAGA